MISINKLSYFLGDRALYTNMSWHIKPKDKIGLIGANGAGKSTLLRLIDGEYVPDEGDISKARDSKIGFLNQDLLSYESEKPIIEVVLEAFEQENAIMHQINDILKKLETDYTDKLVERLTNLQEQFEALGGNFAATRRGNIRRSWFYNRAINHAFKRFFRWMENACYASQDFDCKTKFVDAR